MDPFTSLWAALLLAVQAIQIAYPLGTELDYSGGQLTPEIIQGATRRFPLPTDARVLYIHETDGPRGGQTTVQFELPARSLAAFLASGPFKSVRLEATRIEVGSIQGSSWFSLEQSRNLKKRGTFLSGSVRLDFAYFCVLSILIDTSNPDVDVIYLQDEE